MTAFTFHHFGVPTQAKNKDETYIEGGKVFITDAESHPFRIEFLRFEKDSPMHEDVKVNCHAAFMVESLEEAMEGRQVIIRPFDATETLRVAFIKEGDAVIELMQAL